jgi:hypothetical protein
MVLEFSKYINNRLERYIKEITSKGSNELLPFCEFLETNQTKEDKIS